MRKLVWTLVGSAAIGMLSGCGDKQTDTGAGQAAPPPANSTGVKSAAPPPAASGQPPAPQKKTMDDIVKEAGFTADETKTVSGILKEIGISDMLAIRPAPTQNKDDTLDSSVVLQVVYLDNGSKNESVWMRVTERKVRYVSDAVEGDASKKTYYRTEDGGVLGKLGGVGLTETERVSFYEQTMAELIKTVKSGGYNDFYGTFERDKHRFAFMEYNGVVTVTGSAAVGDSAITKQTKSFSGKFDKSTGKMTGFRVWK